MKILLTGASGLLGAHLLEQGLKTGLEFKAVARKVSRRSFLFQVIDQVEVLSLDLTDPESWPTDIFDKIDVVIHCAALASAFNRDENKMRLINIEGTKNLFQAAKKYRNSQLKKWVQISSVATLSSGEGNESLDENRIGKFRPTPYAKTKYEADCWLNDNRGQMDLLTIHPCYMLGPWDARPSSGVILFGFFLKKIKYLIDATKNFVSPRDVAIGIYQALKANAQGHFVLGGENLKLSKFVELVTKHLQLNSIETQLVDKASLQKLDLDEDQVAIIKEFSLTDAISWAKASEAFGYNPQTIVEQMILETVQYFINNRMLRLTGKAGSNK
jgi:nucleoside-diphosphate-sugar epimerase